MIQSILSARSLVAPALGVMLAGGSAYAQDGGSLPELEFLGFGQTEATSFEDFEGRLVLIEVFAYW